MRFLPLVLLAATTFAQRAPEGTKNVQQGLPRVDAIDFYGLKRVSVNLARQALGLKEGDLLPPSKEDAEDRLLDIDRVVNAHLEAVCCDENKTVLYVGIEEYGGPHYAVRPAPGGAAVLPEALVSPGRPLPATAIDPNLAVIREVLRESDDELHRALAVDLLSRSSRKAEIVDDLQFALTDNDADVRARAIRALITAAPRDRVKPEWFVPMITSIAYTDRQGAVSALGTLTQNGDRAVLNQLRGDTLAALIEMARWQTRTHAYPSFLLIGRIAGLREFEIRDAWDRAGRETVIGQALAKIK